MDENPMISVGMSVHNNERTIFAALKSLQKQTLTNWELILINDGSTDATLAVAQSFADQRIQIISYADQLGLARRLNQAIDMSRGKYFARMDGDDVCFPERFARQVDYLQRFPETDLLGAGSVFFGADGAPLGCFKPPTEHHVICKDPWSGFSIPHPSWMGRLEWFRENRYDARVWKAQDFELLFRTHRRSRFSAIAEPMIGYRCERMSLRKSVTSRYSMLVAQWRHALVQAEWSSFLLSVMGQTAKAFIEAVFMGVGCERELIARRVQPLSREVAERWSEIWGDCQP